MRIEFARDDRAPCAWPAGSLRIGCAADNDIRLTGGAIADHHVTLHQDARGLVLIVDAGAGRVYVNARPVRERALLRPGDSVAIGNRRLRLVADAAAADREDDDGDAAAVMALRAVAGPLSGRVYALDQALALDAREPHVVVGDTAAPVLTPHGRHAWLDATQAAAAGSVRVDGRNVREAQLADGDQIAIGPHRFVIDISADTPALPPADTVRSRERELTEPRKKNHAELWWLLATAALVALALAAALLLHY
jgi:pSer/pThr/pTyr-binding forkhead associated (FHA) protein